VEKKPKHTCATACRPERKEKPASNKKSAASAIVTIVRPVEKPLFPKEKAVAPTEMVFLNSKGNTIFHGRRRMGHPRNVLLGFSGLERPAHASKRETEKGKRERRKQPIMWVPSSTMKKMKESSERDPVLLALWKREVLQIRKEGRREDNTGYFSQVVHRRMEVVTEYAGGDLLFLERENIRL